MTPTPCRPLAAVLLLAAAPALAQVHPSHERGFATEATHRLSEIDAINLLNGNVALRIPLGLDYPVGGGMSYGLLLSYNSKAWDHVEVTQGGQVYAQALPDRLANAGVGWSVSLGRLLAPDDPANDYGSWQWVYVAPDGADHVFYQGLHVTGTAGVDPCSATCFSRDSTYLRMRKLSTTSRVVEHPDGAQHFFTRFTVGSAFEWRITSIRDRFDDGLTDLDIAYSSDGNTWTLTDKHGRVQTLVFEADPAGFHPRRLQRVDLTAFNTATPATYTFTYLAPQTVTVPCSSTLPGWSSVTVSLLASVTQPDGSAYAFTYHHPTAGGNCRARALLQGLTLPTLGKLEWTYRLHTLPVQSCTGKDWDKLSAGVATRRMLDAAGSEVGSWTYTSALSTPPASGSHTCPSGQAFTAPSEQLTATLVTPLKDKLVHYFSVWPGAEFAVTTSFSQADYGLPFTRSASDATGTRFLSSEVLDCDANGNNCGTSKRSIYRTFQRDADAQCGTPWSADCLASNRRQSSQRTVYHDDGNRYADLDSSDFDGFGHYRSEATNGNFGAGNVRSVFVNYNPGNALPGSNWILETFSERQVTEGSTAKSELCFNTTTGALERERVYKSGTVRDATDVVVVFTRDNAGNITSERYYGGDGAALSTTAGLCSLTLPAEAYRIDYTHQSGALESARWVDAAGTPFTYYEVKRTIDWRTGLPGGTAPDPQGPATALEYDAMGRLTWEKPASGHASWTEYTYTRATSSTALANLLIRRRDNGSMTATVRAQERVYFDAFGRPWREQELMPDGTWNNRETLYNGMGLRTSDSEIQSGAATERTDYLFYDPFGRPGTIRPADGASHEVTFTYSGDRLATRSAKVGTTFLSGTVSESAATVTEEYDRQGRLWKRTEPVGPAGEAVVTRYLYEVGGRVREICLALSGGVCGQRRVFTYDNRGFLISERHPEKGTAGDGTVTYSNHDARGLARRMVDGPNDLTYTRDRAGRLTQIRETGGQQRLLKTFTYGTSSSVGNWKNGKLEQASRYNYVVVGSTAQTVRVDETYFWGSLGIPRRRDTSVVVGTLFTDSFTQSYVRDDLANLTSITYPQCTACPTPAPRTVSFTYSQGRLASVTGYASSIAYHPNTAIHQIHHDNGVTDNLVRDADSMFRPAAINAVKGTTTLWATGTYTYDGSGNVKGIGASWFEHYPSSRIKTGTLFDHPVSGGTQRKQSYTYDSFGNLTAITTQVGAGTPSTRNTPTSLTTNRLTGSVSYDATGNLTAWNGASYQYDAFGMMSRMTSGTEDWYFVYNADDERLLSFRAGSAQHYRYTLRHLDGQVLREYLRLGSPAVWSVERDYVYRRGVLLAAETPAGVRHFHLDHLGSPRLVTDAAGNQTAYHLYYPFGEEASSPTQDSERLKFTGHERDLNATGGATPAADDLDYMHARFYNPQLGRFTTPDPLTVGRLASQSLNRYAYANNNPVTMVDPFGLDPVTTVNGGTIHVVGRLFKLPAVASSLWDRSFLTRRSSSGKRPTTPRRPYSPPKRERVVQQEELEWFGVGCDEIINFASSVGVAGGALFGGAIDLNIVWGNRIELTFTGGVGLSGGLSVAVLGASYGKSEGGSVGGNVVAGMPAGFNGMLSVNSPSATDEGSIFLGVGPGVTPTFATAGGGWAYTFAWDFCE